MHKRLIFALWVALAATAALAQLDRGTIIGTVTDPSGAAIPGARVAIRHVATGEGFVVSANEAGQFTRPNLPSGDYQITVEAQGFKRLVRTGVNLRVTDVLRVDAQLEVGGVTDSVEVRAEVARLQTDTPEVGTALSNKALVDLPMSFASGRRAESFAYAVSPGVTGSTTTSHINGSTAYSKEMLVDGASTTVNQSGDYTAALVSIEALQEVKIQTSGLSAEFGRTQGGVFNFVMKSGANQAHGSAYFSIRNEALNANTFSNKFRGASRSTDRKQNYAASFGGPVWIPKIYNGRDKTFFYVSFERYKERSYGLGAPTRTVPVAEFYEGDFSRLLGGATAYKDVRGNAVYQGAIYDPLSFVEIAPNQWVGDVFPQNKIPVSRFSAVSRKLNEIAKAHYLPTLRDAAGNIRIQNNMSFPTSTQPEWDRYQYSFKVDHILNPNHRLAFSGNHQYSPRLILDSGGMWDPTDLHGGPLAKARTRDDTGSFLRMAYDWTVRPTLLNHLNLSYNHRGNPQKVTMAGIDGAAELGIKNLHTIGYPAINWGGGPFVTLENPGFGSNSFRADMSWGVLDTVSFSRGRHFFKAGIDHRRNHQNLQGSMNPTITFSATATSIPGAAFAGNYTGYAFASYLLGIVDSAALADPVPLGGRIHYWGMFFQDDFRVSSRLTLNLGLRWEYQPPLFEVANRLSSWNPNKIDPASKLPGAYDFAGSCPVCTGKRDFGSHDYKDFGPRFGFAWRGPAGLVFRGGYGIVYEANSFNGYSPTGLSKATNVQAGGTYSLERNSLTPWAGIFNWDNGFPTDRYKPASYNASWGNENRPGMIDPGYGLSPYVQQWNFNLQRELFKRTTLDVGYVGNKGTRLRIGELARVNQLPVSVLKEYGTRLSTQIRSAADAQKAGIPYPYDGFAGSVASALRPYPQVSGTNTVNNWGAPLGFSTHHALQVTVNREMKNGFAVYANYVWARTMSNVESSLAPGNGDNGNRPLDYYNLGLEKAPADYDIAHAFKAYVSYDLPYRGRGRVKTLLGGWSVSAILNYLGGMPLGFTSPSALANYWNGAVNRPNIAAGEMKAAGFDKSSFELSSPQSKNNTYLNKALYSNPPSLSLGTAARLFSNVREFATLNEDVGLQKSHRITEQVRFQLRAEFLNVFNRHRLTGINTSVNNASFGQVTGVSGNRQVQVSARVDF